MSKDSNEKRRSPINDQHHLINRRSFVKSLSVAGGAAGFGSFGTRSVSASGASSDNYGPSDIKVTNVEPRQTPGPRTMDVVTSSDFAQKLRDEVINKGVPTDSRLEGFDISPGSETVAYEVTTDNKEVNATDPVLTTELSVQESTADDARGAVGVVHTLTARGERDRGLVGGLGAVVDRFESSDRGRIFGVSDGDVVQMKEKRVSQSQDQVSTQSLLSCSGCKNAISVLCGIFGVGVGGVSCLAICSPTSPVPPIFVNCEIDCGVIIGSIVTLTCTEALGYLNACERAGDC